MRKLYKYLNILINYKLSFFIEAILLLFFILIKRLLNNLYK